jgi:hypothetical protein
MKRAFFFGLGVSLILVGVALLSVGHVAMPTRETFAWAWASSTEGDQRWGSIAVGLIAVLASGIAIWAAKHSPPSHSWMIAILFWMLGYLATGVLLVPFVVAFVLTNPNMTYIECLHNAARKTDDGRSDAITIAMAIKSQCVGEFARSTETYSQGMNPQARRMFEDRVESRQLELATMAVLDERGHH